MEPEPQQGTAQNPGELLVFLIRKDTKCSECSEALRLDPGPVRLAVIAAVRRQFTNYDRLLLQGIERHEARALVSGTVERKLGEWSAGRATGYRLLAPGGRGTPNGER
jgi:hypothetical protein